MAPEGDCGRVIEDRYTLSKRLGSGAHGDVWVAHDRILGESVALKWMRFVHGKMQARVRREISTLRTLRFPGIVRFVDEGIADDRPFLVMELVNGRPFPGTESPRSSWSTIAGPTLALLETLAHVHSAGVIHRDLKPENILVRPDGLPVMLDFGVSLLPTLGSKKLTSEGQIIGTPLYLAPEQILDKPADVRTDLYALGVILHEALTGRVPHDAKDMLSIVRMRLGGSPKSILELEPTIPSSVGAVVNRLLAVRPEDRFSSAMDVIAALRGEASTLVTTPWGSDVTHVEEEQLRALFSGPERLFHLRSDAARILFARTGGNVLQVEAELTQWLRIGLARSEGPVFVVDRAALDRLVVGVAGTEFEQKWRKQLAAGLVSEAVFSSLESARQFAERGDLGAATMFLTEALRLARHEELIAEERAVLAQWTKVALAEGSARALDGALYEIVRTQHSNSDTDRLQALLRAALAAPGANGFQALEMVDDLGPFADVVLERARQRIRIIAVASRASPALLAEVLEEIDEWAENSGESLAELCAAEGQARRRYHEGRFVEAARLYNRAAELEPWTTGRIEAKLRGASALLEAFAHEQAENAAREAGRLAFDARHSYGEARAEWLIRSAEYRLGKTRKPDSELVDAAARVGALDLEALVCLNEAAVAMRGNLPEECQRLADRAAAIWRGMGRPYATMLARALAISVGASATDDEIDLLVQRAIACKGPGIGLQTLGLLGKVFPDKRSSWQNALAGLSAFIPKEHWAQRMDVLSVDESLAFARI